MNQNTNQMQMNNAIQNVTNVHVNVPSNPTMIVMNNKTGPGVFTRIIWFVFVGWWLTGLVIYTAYLAMITIVGLPLAFWLLNRVPTAMTLKPRQTKMTAVTNGGVTTLTVQKRDQLAWYIRAPYFLLVGWWAGLIWLTLAYIFMLTIIGIPVAYLMVDKIGTVVTLEQH